MQKPMVKMLSMADVVTIINAIFGFLSIIMALSGELHLSFSFILLAILADGLDGMISRRRGHSSLGDYLESTADTITTGVAVCVFIYYSYQNIFETCIYKHIIFIIILVIYLICNIIRLASFPSLKSKGFFTGMPAPAGAIILTILAYIYVDYLIMLPVVLVVSPLLIINIRFPKQGMKINIFAFILIILTIVFGTSYNEIFPIVLLLAIFLYMIGGSVYLYSKK